MAVDERLVGGVLPLALSLQLLLDTFEEFAEDDGWEVCRSAIC